MNRSVQTFTGNLFRAAMVTLPLIAVLMAASFAGAQEHEYDVLPYEPKAQTLDVAKILRGDLPLEGNKEAFKDHFVRGIWGEMTAPGKMDELTKIRQSYGIRHAKLASKNENKNVLGELNEITMELMTKIIVGNYHPSVQYHAVLFLGELDQRPGVEFGDGKGPPVPYPPACEVLVKAYQGARMPEYIKVGAMLGMLRHADYGMTAKNRALVTAAIIPLLGEKTPPANRDAEAHAWMRRRGVEILAGLKDPGVNNRNAQIFVAVLKDKENPLSVRCAAAEALLQLNYERNTNIVPAEIAQHMGDLILDVTTAERARLRDLDSKNLQRQVYVELGAIRTGLEMPEKFGDGEVKALVAKLTKSIDGVLAQLSKGSEELALDDTLADFISQVEAAVGKPQPAPAAPAKAATGTADASPPAKAQEPGKPAATTAAPTGQQKLEIN